MTTQATCAERLPEHLAGRLEDFADILTRLSGGDEEQREEASNEQYELPLDIEIRRSVKILLSTGGPADWFTVDLDNEGDVLAIRYTFQDWFDGAEQRLEGEQFKMACEFLEPLIEGIMDVPA